MQCQGITYSKTQCSRKAGIDCDYCWQHQDNIDTSKILKKFPASEYKIEDITYDSVYGYVFKVNSKCGLACDSPASYYDINGKLLYNDHAPQLSIGK